MEAFFRQLWNTGIQAGFIICIVLLVRLAFTLGRVPKRFSYALWLIPFLRMLLPWQPESDFSMMPRRAVTAGSDAIDSAAAYAGQLQISAGLRQAAGTVGGTGTAEAGNETVMQLCMVLASTVWLVGILLLLTYSVFSYLKLKKRLACSVRLEENIYLSDGIATPFVLGFFRPRIYLPSDIQENELVYVTAHERTHIRRKDHIIKILAFFVTCIYWFCPLAWLAFIMMGKDMELSCDEAVMRQFGEDCKREYALVLLALSGGRRHVSGIPLAFGEGNVKSRVTNIMKYKKPVLFAAAAGVAALILLAAGLLTNPKSECLLPETEEEVKRNEEMEKVSETETEEEEQKAEQGEEQEQLLNSGQYAMEVDPGTLTPTGMTVILYNRSNQNVFCGEDFHLSRLEGEAWVDVPYIIDNWGFNEPAYTIGKDGLSMNVDWEWLYGRLEPGTYLFTKSISIEEKDGSYSDTELGTMFTLEK